MQGWTLGEVNKGEKVIPPVEGTMRIQIWGSVLLTFVFSDEITEMCADASGKALMLDDKINGTFKKEMLSVGTVRLRNIYVL